MYSAENLEKRCMSEGIFFMKTTTLLNSLQLTLITLCSFMSFYYLSHPHTLPQAFITELSSKNILLMILSNNSLISFSVTSVLLSITSFALTFEYASSG